MEGSVSAVAFPTESLWSLSEATEVSEVNMVLNVHRNHKAY